jgi:hypothetical protein
LRYISPLFHVSFHTTTYFIIFHSTSLHSITLCYISSHSTAFHYTPPASTTLGHLKLYFYISPYFLSILLHSTIVQHILYYFIVFHLSLSYHIMFYCISLCIVGLYIYCFPEITHRQVEYRSDSQCHQWYQGLFTPQEVSATSI